MISAIYNFWFEETYQTNKIQHKYGGELLSCREIFQNKRFFRAKLVFGFFLN